MLKSTLPAERQAPGVRSRLAILVFTCVLPIAFIAMLLVYFNYQGEQAHNRSEAVSRVRAMVSALDREFGKTEAALLALSTAESLESHDLKQFHAAALRALSHIDAGSILMLDTSGQLLLSTRRAFGEPLPKLSHTPLLKRMIATGKPGVSDLFYGPIVHSPMVAIGVPIVLKGALTYSLNAMVEPERIGAILSEQKIPDSWLALIADSSTTIVARSHESKKFIGRKIPVTLSQRMRLHDEGAFDTVTLEGVSVMTAFSRSQRYHWSVALGIPIAETTSGIRRTMAWLLASTLAALALGLAAAWVIGGRIAGSVSALSVPAAAIGAGQKSPAIPPLHFREADELGAVLVTASHTLHQAVQEHAQVLAALRDNESALKQAQRLAKVGNWRWDVANDVHTWSEETYRIYQRDPALPPAGIGEVPRYYTPETWGKLSAAVHECLATGKPYECDAEMVHADGSHLWISARGEPVRDADGKLIGLRGTIQDISERKEAEELRYKEERSRHLAMHDPLTGLPNRMLLLDRLAHGIERTRREGGRLALMFVDLDRFKLVNDTEGHDIGDALLIEIARRIHRCLRQADTVARIGGDEFIIQLDHVVDTRTCDELAGKVIDAVSMPATLQGRTVQVGASIGIALFPDHAADAAALMKAADSAMYAAKEAGRGIYRFCRGPGAATEVA